MTATMSKTVILLFSLAAITAINASSSFQDEWIAFKKKYNKVYIGPQEHLRFTIYKSNMKEIQKHNKLYAKGLSTFYLGENEFADMTTREISERMSGCNITAKLPTNVEKVDVSGLPESIDWRTKGYVTSVKDQKNCGSCWAFSAIGSLEGQHFAATKKLVDLSASNLVDCSSKWGNHGCAWGGISKTFKYIIDNKGVDTESSYPYVPSERKCAFKAANVGATMTGYKKVSRGSESALQQAVAKVGPVSVCIDTHHVQFLRYRCGVLNVPSCSSTKLNHCATVVGYGVLHGKEYWLVKNSWGARWGCHGYVLMSRNKNNQCGIASAARYPIV